MERLQIEPSPLALLNWQAGLWSAVMRGTDRRARRDTFSFMRLRAARSASPGSFGMSVPSSLIATAALGTLSAAAIAETPEPGRFVSPDEIALRDISIDPASDGFPPRSETAKQRETVYSVECRPCRGEKGSGPPDDTPVRETGGSTGDQRAVKRPSAVSGPTRAFGSTMCAARCGLRRQNRSATGRLMRAALISSIGKASSHRTAS